jgi:hypothetical protein
MHISSLFFAPEFFTPSYISLEAAVKRQSRQRPFSTRKARSIRHMPEDEKYPLEWVLRFSKRTRVILRFCLNWRHNEPRREAP